MGFTAFAQPGAFTVHFEDVDVMGQAIQNCACEALAKAPFEAEEFGFAFAEATDNARATVGVTTQDAHRRVANARNDPTFLLAPVDIVATYELKNLSRSKVESLLHRFFDAARPRDQRWSCFFDQFAALLRWIRVSHQAAILMGSVLLAWTSSGVKMPWVECGRSAL